MIGRVIRRTKGSSRGIGLPCRHCQKAIASYPFFSKSKRTRGGKKWYYHIDCAVELGLIEYVPKKEETDEEEPRGINPLGLSLIEAD